MTLGTTRDLNTDSQVHYHYGHRTRIAMIVLLVIVLLFAGAALFLKFKLEELRSSIQNQAELRIGAQITAGDVKVNGLRGLRISGFAMNIDRPGSPLIQVEVPEVYLYIDLIGLFYGEVAVNRLQMDDARIVMQRRANDAWIAKEGTSPDALLGEEFKAFSFRVSGDRASLKVSNIFEGAGLRLDNLAFDLFRPLNSPDLHLSLSGLLNGAANHSVSTTIRFRSLKDFDVHALCAQLTAQDAFNLFPASQNLLSAGSVSPDLRLWGGPANTLVLGLEMPFNGLMFTAKPANLLPNTGVISALASYSVDDRLLTLSTAKATATGFSGRVEGTVSFQTEKPLLDLHLQAKELPIARFIDDLLQVRSEEYGQFTVGFQEPYTVGLGLKGPADALQVTAEAGVTAGTVKFVPKNPLWPSADLQFSHVEAAWQNNTSAPEGVLSISGGTFVHKTTGISGERVNGTLSLRTGEFAADPFSVFVRGQQFSGNFRYTLATRTAQFALAGVISELEKTPLGAALADTTLQGNAGVQGNGSFAPNAWHTGLNLDLTQTHIAHRWWLEKPAGIGLFVRDAAVDVVPRKTLKWSGTVQVDTTPIKASAAYIYRDGKYRTQSARLETDALDVATAAKCLRIPYSIAGGTGAPFFLEWSLPEGKEPGWPLSLHVGGQFNNASFTAVGATTPVSLQGASVEVRLDNQDTAHRTGSVVLKAVSASLPPLGATWLVPLKPDNPVIAAKYAEEPRDWTYQLSADQLEMPPWKGTAFTATAYGKENETGLDKFAATVDGGHIEGVYRRVPSDNAYTLTANWTAIPAFYIIRHLKFPELLQGTMDGHIAFSMDLDDPNTLRGEGHFDIRDGQFSADYLSNQFKEQLKGDLSALPPSLRFTKFSGDVQLEGDIVRTPSLSLEAPGIQITGKGQYVLEGDMDYAIQISIAPNVAAQMPIIKEKLLVAGHKITQNNIVFGLHVQGPTFKPNSQVVSLPSVGVTLVSGAAEVIGEGVKIFDTPRQLLVDVMKIFGGIVGAGGK